MSYQLSRIFNFFFKFQVFENRVFGEIFRHMQDDISDKFRMLRTKELRDVYSSPNLIRVMDSRRL